MISRFISSSPLRFVGAAIRLITSQPNVFGSIWNVLYFTGSLTWFSILVAVQFATLLHPVFFTFVVLLGLTIGFLAWLSTGQTLSTMIAFAIARRSGRKLAFRATYMHLRNTIWRATMRDGLGALGMIFATAASVFPYVVLCLPMIAPRSGIHGAAAFLIGLPFPLLVVTSVVGCVMSAYMALALHSLLLQDLSLSAALRRGARTFHSRPAQFVPILIFVMLVSLVVFTGEHALISTIIRNHVAGVGTSTYFSSFYYIAAMIAAIPGAALWTLQTLPYIYACEEVAGSAGQATVLDFLPEIAAETLAAEIARRGTAPYIFRQVLVGLAIVVGLLILACLTWPGGYPKHQHYSSVTQTKNINIRAFGLPNVPSGFRAYSLTTTGIEGIPESQQQLLLLTSNGPTAVSPETPIIRIVRSGEATDPSEREMGTRTDCRHTTDHVVTHAKIQVPMRRSTCQVGTSGYDRARIILHHANSDVTYTFIETAPVGKINVGALLDAYTSVHDNASAFPIRPLPKPHQFTQAEREHIFAELDARADHAKIQSVLAEIGLRHVPSNLLPIFASEQDAPSTSKQPKHFISLTFYDKAGTLANLQIPGIEMLIGAVEDDKDVRLGSLIAVPHAATTSPISIDHPITLFGRPMLERMMHYGAGPTSNYVDAYDFTYDGRAYIVQALNRPSSEPSAAARQLIEAVLTKP